jgi:hypothetical protein
MIKNITYSCLAVTLLLFFWIAEVGAYDKFPRQVIGAWVVVGVRVDTHYAGRAYYQYDDGRLRGKTVHIWHTEAKGNLPEKLLCKAPSVTEENCQLDDLLYGTMAGDEDDARNGAKKFMLPIDGNVTVTALWVSCKDGDIGPDSPPGPKGQNWLVLLPDGKLAIRWYDNTILLLKREGDVKPVTR